MAKRRKLKGVKKHRRKGHRPKHNKRSVAYRKILKKVKTKQEKRKNVSFNI